MRTSVPSAYGDDIRIALEWSRTSAPPDAFAQLAADATTLFRMRNRLRDGLEWSQRALAAAPARTGARAQLLRNAAAVSAQIGDAAQGWSLIEDSVELWREVGDPVGMSGARRFAGGLALDRDDVATAMTLLSEAEALATSSRFLSHATTMRSSSGFAATSRRRSG